MRLSEELQGIHPSNIRFPGYLSKRAQNALAQARSKLGISPSDKSRDGEALATAIRDSFDEGPSDEVFVSQTAPNEWMASRRVGDELVTVVATTMSGAVAKAKSTARAPELTPNRALTRHKLEALAWEQTPRDYRGSSGSRREVLLNTTEGTTLVPLGDMTDFQLRRYIGPGRLEEAGDMRKNGSEEDLSFDLREYGANMQHWHSSGGDPIYAVGSYAYSYKVYPKPEVIEEALSELEGMLRKPHSSWKAADKRELRTLIEQTQELCSVASQQTPNGRGIYSGTAAQEDDYVIHKQGGRFHHGGGRYYVDRIGRSGTHTQIGLAKGCSTLSEAREVCRKDAHTRGIKAGVVFEQRGDELAQIGHADPRHEANSRREEPDEQAARELSLYIENEYSLVGAPNSQGKAIEKNLLRKIKNGTFDLALSEKAWMYLMETGAKKYAKEYADGREWSKIFNKPTRELVAHEFATTFAEEHRAPMTKNGADFGVVEFDAPAEWASAFINGDTSGLEEESLEELDAWQAKNPELGWVVDASEESHVGRWNGLQTDLLTYTAHIQGS